MLRTILMLALAAALAHAGPPAAGAGRPPTQAAPAWERFTYPGEEFSAEWPEMPFADHQRRPEQFGGGIGYASWEIRERMRVFGLSHGGVVYMVFSFDAPLPKESLEFYATAAHGGVTVRPGGGNLRLDGFDGREYDIKGGLARVFRAKEHAYMVSAAARDEKDRPSVVRFLDSFSLAKPRQGRKIEKDWYERAAAPPPDEPLEDEGITVRPVIVYRPTPMFTDMARRNNTRGVVRLRAVLSSDGRVRNIKAVQKLPDGLTGKAVEAARHLLFYPAEKDGRRVSLWVTIEYGFSHQ